MTRLRDRASTTTLVAALLCMMGPAWAQTPAAAPQPFSYTTNWYAQAEHGGFYQALATGLYERAGLDVTLRMGGPQVNVMQLLAAGRTDCVMGYDVQTLAAWQQGIPAMTVAAAFQKDPAVLIGHPGVVDRLEELKGKTLLLSAASHTSFWPWLRTRYGLQDSQLRPYNFSIQPFLADKRVVQQGLLSSEPYAIQTQSRVKPNVFLLADHGWPPYAETIVCLEKTVRERPQQVAAFVKATMEGWKSYLKGDPTPGNALIVKDNPNMTPALISHGIKMMNQSGMVFGGDAARYGVGVITDGRMRQTYDLLVQMKLLDPAKVNLEKTYTTEFVKDLRVMP
jgi:NitT/TauT family transport system substrate-binding protein